MTPHNAPLPQGALCRYESPVHVGHGRTQPLDLALKNFDRPLLDADEIANVLGEPFRRGYRDAGVRYGCAVCAVIFDVGHECPSPSSVGRTSEGTATGGSASADSSVVRDGGDRQ